MPKEKNYSVDFARKIMEECNRKGWNLYKGDNNKTADEIIKNNLAQKLAIGTSYVMLPVANDPKDPKQVFDALERLAKKLDRKMQTITVECRSYALPGFTLEKENIKLHSPEGIHVSYESFLKALDSVVNV